MLGLAMNIKPVPQPAERLKSSSEKLRKHLRESLFKNRKKMKKHSTHMQRVKM